MTVSPQDIERAARRIRGHVRETPLIEVAAGTVAGQGTLGREWDAQWPSLDTLLVAVGGGGLIAGIAAWYQGRLKIVSVEPERSRALHAALEGARPLEVPVGGIAADSLGASK